MVSAPGLGQIHAGERTVQNGSYLDFSISYTTVRSEVASRTGRNIFCLARPSLKPYRGRRISGIRRSVWRRAKCAANIMHGAAFFEPAENRGNDLLLDIDVQGASKIKEKIPDAVSIFIFPPDREKLEWRSRTRGLDSEKKRDPAAARRSPARKIRTIQIRLHLG